MKDFKDTLFMGKTAFEMRGNLGQKEPAIQQKWEELDLYNKVIEKNKDKRAYTLHDGPPYANGEIHLGHSLNKILKDIVVRYKNMNGFISKYIPGWDTHGLPIELAITKKGINRKNVSIDEFRKHCERYAHEQVAKQMKGFKRLGVLADYDHKYLTLQPEFERDQIRIFAAMVEKGLIYKGLKPVYWSPSSESALAEAEIEYQDKEDLSIYFTLPIVNNREYEGVKFLVWTTTPWTLPANLAVCAGPDISYVLINSNKGKLILGKDLLTKLTELLELEDVEVLKELAGKDLENIEYKHPLFDRISPCILGDHVTTVDGSGLVHTAPGHGEDDYNVGKLYNLDILCPVDNHGYMTSEAFQYEGLSYTECNEQVIKDLDACGHLLKVIKIVHSYPHDWRTKKPVIFRATPQWFASIDKIKDDLLANIKNITWYPKWGDVRMSNMIRDRHDWCISRQRAWGVPIPIFYCEDGTAVLDKEVLEHVALMFGKYGSNCWFTLDNKELLPEGYTNEHSPNGLFTKEKDTMDVWFDSGSSYMTLGRNNINFPADLYLEGSDQYRGWFNSSLITAVSMYGVAPYKTVVTHGFTLDGQGRKMSKSLGNTVDPIKVCNESGADILRLWVASVDYQSDMPMSKELLKQVSESYRKIRNTVRFMLANTSDFDPKNSLSFNELANIDKYMFIKLQNFIKEVKEAYDTFRFGDVYRLVNTYINNTLSSFYLDFTKDILYILDPKDKIRLSTQTVFYNILLTLLQLLTPIIPHTTSEAYSYLTGEKALDIYLTDIPTEQLGLDPVLEANFDKFMTLRQDILKALEEARAQKIIGKSFNAKVTIKADKETYDLLNNLDVNLAQILIVSKLELVESDSFEVIVEEAKGHVCSRCWMIVDSVDEDGLCDRCKTIVENL